MKGLKGSGLHLVRLKCKRLFNNNHYLYIIGLISITHDFHVRKILKVSSMDIIIPKKIMGLQEKIVKYFI